MRGKAAWTMVVVTGVVVTGVVVGLWWWHGHGRGGLARTAEAGAGKPMLSGNTAASPAKRATVATRDKSLAEEMPTNRLAYRLRNTRETEKELLGDDRALLLQNAEIDTSRPLSDLNLPDKLKAPADNRNWLVQAKGPISPGFRAVVAGTGAQVVSYIPNNAELVVATGAAVQQLEASPWVAAVVPYAPYYKLTDPNLLKLAVTGADLPPDVGLRVGVYPGMQGETEAALQALGAEVTDEGASPFGEILGVHPAAGTLVSVAQLGGVMVVEAEHRRVGANDLTRARLGVAANPVTNQDYLGLSGQGVVVAVNDSGVDTSHPDLAGRLILDATAKGQDPVGHGTHVIGTILGSGVESATVGTNASGSPTNANFRGMATNAQAYVIELSGFETRPNGVSGTPSSDAYLQETAGRTNAQIDNNSWDYGGDAGYDMAAAGYDMAVRDSVPEWTGPQYLAYVFSAGNNGGAASDGTGGIADTVLSPGTAKNVITVGSIEQLRDITNKDVVGGVTNQPWLAETDSSNQVADFSSRGNVGVGIEGEAGRFKPDVVAPGTFVLSDKAASWDQAGYYNPTNVTVNTLYNQTVTNGVLSPYSIFVPANAVSLTITLVTNDFSPEPFPSLPIYIGFNDNPTTNAGGYDLVGNGTITISGAQLPAGSEIFYSVGDATNGLVGYDINTAVATTNDNGNYLTVLSNLNASLGPYYRYESGTSMSAAGVSGMLALMEEYLTNRLGLINPSPALMKALLINGSRTVSSQYDLSVNGALTSQGWGLPDLSNSIPGALTNGGVNLPVQFFDQWTNMLATGQSHTRQLKLANGAGSQPLRVTLVWTDPPGNPAAGVKLVNDLDLVVSNVDNGAVFYGNDIPAGSDYNQAESASNAPVLDAVNNVENVYLFPPLGTNYTVTVRGHRVNVNAVDANTSNVVQDYALVVSYGDGGVSSNAFALTDEAVVSSNVASVAGITNGIPVLNQRVGGNPQFAETNGNTNGVIGQWQFYIFTNTASLMNAAYTNVAFVTFDPPNLGVPIMGVREEANPGNGVRAEADIDLYVSTDSNLLNLNPATVNAATTYKSLSRTGTEKVLLTGQPAGQVYYVGVKSEDQEGAQYGFVAVALTNSFGQFDSNGNVVLTVLTPPLPAQIPGGTPAQPGSVTVLALTTADVQARKVVIEDTVTHQEFGDLVGVVGHGNKTAVLNNHSFFVDPGDTTETFIYDDSGENGDQFILNNGTPGAYVPPFSVNPPPNTATPRHTDGPGTLTSFVGDNVSDGIWTLTMVNDSSPNDSGTIDNWTAFVEPQSPNNGFSNNIPADSWYYDFVDVPADATNLVITVGISGATPGPVDLYVRQGAFPDLNDYDKFEVIDPPGGTMTLSVFDSPPLNAGTYFIGVFNPNANPVTVSAHWTLGLAAAGPPPLNILSAGNEPILDDAVTYSTNHVGAVSRVVSVEVGVRINHPRESDLVLTLVSPSGTRVLLAENRGGLDTNGYGHGTDVTNYVGSETAGSFTPTNTVIPVGTNSGTLDIAYNFFTIPDDLRVYYGGQRIFDSGLISGAGTFTVDFGPGSATNVTIAMNEPGTNPNGTNGDAWTYQVDEITKAITYATFTEDTNKTTTPIKFAVPPFGGAPQYLPTVTNVISTFDTNVPGVYSNTVDGWTVNSNSVTVVAVTALAANEGSAIAGTNVLALHNGSITRVLPTMAGQTYTLTFESHGRPAAGPYSSPGPAGWWKGDNTPNDFSGNGFNGTLQNAATYAPGEVSNAFYLTAATQSYVSAPNSPIWGFGTNDFTAEFWVNFRTWNPAGSFGHPDAIFIGDDDAVLSQNKWFMAINANELAFHINSPVLGTGLWLVDSPFSPVTTQWYHLAVTRQGDLFTIYTNGAVIGSQNQVVTIPTPSAPLTIGQAETSGYIDGLMDEVTIFTNALSILQIQDIYAAGSAGKCLAPPLGSYTPVNANVVLDGQTNEITGTGNDNWGLNSYTFTASSNGTVLTIAPEADGLLVDSFVLGGAAELNPANDYLPEETLNVLQGENSEGDWKLEAWDNRLGATNPQPTLVSWQLSLGLERVNPAALPLNEGIPATNCLQATSVAYYVVYVPVWAGFATNILTVENGTVGLVYNQGALPLTTNGDVTLITSTGTGGTVVLNTTNSAPLLIPGQSYYLAVTNTGPGEACFTIGVDYNLITLTNMVPVSNTLAATTVPAYYQYDVSSNAVAVAFELFNLSGNVNLVARKGFPLPDTNSPGDYNYISQNPGTNDELIVVSSNSTPVVLTPGWWYLGVFNADNVPVNYTIEAAELTPTVIVLTNDERLTTNFSLLQSEETFFEFAITNGPAGALFELYNLNGNVDLTLDQNTLPFSPPFFASSANPGTNEEQIVIRTNQLGMSINGPWYLGVPNETSSNVTFTIHAVVTDTNGLLVSAVPIAPVVVVPSGPGTGPTLTWPSVSGECYEVDSSPDLVNWTELTVVTASGTTTTVTDPNPITGVPARFYRIIQVVCP